MPLLDFPSYIRFSFPFKGVEAMYCRRTGSGPRVTRLALADSCSATSGNVSRISKTEGADSVGQLLAINLGTSQVPLSSCSCI